jgi:hypothetical protein
MARYIKIFFLLLVVSVQLNAAEQDEYSAIISSFESENFTRVKVLSDAFIKKYPASKLMPEILLIQCEIETNPTITLSKLNTIINKYPRYKNADYARYKICEIHYFTSNYEELKKEADKAITLYGKRSRYYSDFVFFSSKASFYKHNFDDSLYTSGELIRDNTKYQRYGELRLQTIYSSQKVNYDSTEYSRSLKNSYFELQGTGSDISSLYLLARHYEYGHKYDYSFSLYTDLITKFPRSPEALLANKRIAILRDQKPKYIPNVLSKIKDEPDDIVTSLSPTSEVNENRSNNYYALTIGPLYNLKEAEILADELRRSFSSVHVVRTYRNFVIYVGRESSTDESMNLKIRLAEEYAINADIIYVTNHNGLNFVHGQ